MLDRWIVAIATGVIAIATIVYSFFAGAQWLALQETNRINNEALIGAQRASILYLGMSATPAGGFNEPNKEHKGSGVVLTPVWTNAGNTAPDDLHVYFGELIKSVTEIERPDMRIPAGTEFITTVIGPKGTRNGALRFLTAEEMADVRDGKLHVYAWGEATYKDGFPGTEPHITQFCDQIGGVANTNPSNVLEGLQIVWNPCKVHNCVDKQCTAK